MSRLLDALNATLVFLKLKRPPKPPKHPVVTGKHRLLPFLSDDL